MNKASGFIRAANWSANFQSNSWASCMFLVLKRGNGIVLVYLVSPYFVTMRLVSKAALIPSLYQNREYHKASLDWNWDSSLKMNTQNTRCTNHFIKTESFCLGSPFNIPRWEKNIVKFCYVTLHLTVTSIVPGFDWIERDNSRKKWSGNFTVKVKNNSSLP